jgi:hypothetical protein
MMAREKIRAARLLAVVFVVALATGCGTIRKGVVDERPAVGAGFRYSEYGPDSNPGPQYWLRVGKEMAARFDGAVPETVWIVGRLQGDGTLLSFPVDEGHPLIEGAATDGNEAALDLFDRSGFRVWLQVEPGHAPVEDLIHLVLARYGHHPSVVGFGVDVEWFESTEEPEGRAVSDAEASAWLAAVRTHDPGYRLFLKHWEPGKSATACSSSTTVRSCRRSRPWSTSSRSGAGRSRRRRWPSSTVTRRTGRGGRSSTIRPAISAARSSTGFPTPEGCTGSISRCSSSSLRDLTTHRRRPRMARRREHRDDDPRSRPDGVSGAGGDRV